MPLPLREDFQKLKEFWIGTARRLSRKRRRQSGPTRTIEIEMTGRRGPTDGVVRMTAGGRCRPLWLSRDSGWQM